MSDNRFEQLDNLLEAIQQHLPNVQKAITKNRSEIAKVGSQQKACYCKNCGLTSKLRIIKQTKNLDCNPSVYRLEPTVLEKCSSSSPSQKDAEVLEKIRQIKDLIELTKKKQALNITDKEGLSLNAGNKKKYLMYLVSMQKKLREIQYKYFTLPNVISNSLKTFKEAQFNGSLPTVSELEPNYKTDEKHEWTREQLRKQNYSPGINSTVVRERSKSLPSNQTFMDKFNYNKETITHLNHYKRISVTDTNASTEKYYISKQRELPSYINHKEPKHRTKEVVKQILNM